MQSTNLEPNHYETLGLEIGESDPRVIKAANFSRTREENIRLLGTNREKAIAKLERIGRAYSVLRDPQLKTQYDALFNRFGIRLAFIPAGEALIGSPVHEVNRRDDESQHLVQISQPFYLAVHTVTQKQWIAVMGTEPWIGKLGAIADTGQPASCVTWDDANNYCSELTRRIQSAGLMSQTSHYRLPTESEWEYACRGGAVTAFHFGNDEGELDSYGWSSRAINKLEERKQGSAQQVGLKMPNLYGIYDLHGNVWEWCADWYGDYPDSAVVDPKGPDVGTCRVIRGGSWDQYSHHARAACRDRKKTNYGNSNLGFRVAFS